MMASKRNSYQDQEGDDRDRQVPGQETKRRHGDSKQAEISAVSNTMKAESMKDIELRLEYVVRKVVREEVPPLLRSLLPPCCRRATVTQIAPSGGKAFQLRFMNKPPPTFFTFSRIVAEDGAPLQIALCDARSENCIVKEGPFSKIKIEICILKGDFGSNGCEDWTAREFKANITNQREGKGPLLKGNRLITLEQGVGVITEIVFTDNSSWTRSRKFSLGAKVAATTSNYEADIREGKSEPFMVKDNRGESYKKHERPSLNDEIWRLKKIRKDGKIHKHLSSHGIQTVKDLLRLNITNQPLLKEIVGGIPKRLWETIIEHAKDCEIDDHKRYIYHTGGQPKSLHFNSIYEVVGVTFDGQEYRPLKSLNLDEKHLVESVKQHAYKNSKDLIEETSTDCSVRQFAGLNGQCVEAESGPGFCQPWTSTLPIYAAESNDQLGICQLPELGEMPLDSSAGGELIPGDYFHGNNSFLGGQVANYHSPIPIPWEQGNPFDSTHGDGAELSYDYYFPNFAMSVDMSSKGKRRTFWYKIRTALKWVIPYAAKRRAQLHSYYY